MSYNNQPLQGQHIKSENGRGTIVYDPTWCETLPYKCYDRGSAEQIFCSLRGALDYMRDRGYSFDYNQEWR